MLTIKLDHQNNYNEKPTNKCTEQYKLTQTKKKEYGEKGSIYRTVVLGPSGLEVGRSEPAALALSVFLLLLADTFIELVLARSCAVKVLI